MPGLDLPVGVDDLCERQRAADVEAQFAFRVKVCQLGKALVGPVGRREQHAVPGRATMLDERENPAVVLDQLERQVVGGTPGARMAAS
jgi:hypothetical protein